LAERESAPFLCWLPETLFELFITTIASEFDGLLMGLFGKNGTEIA